ncbi:STP1 protein [Plasmodium ovale curtisi]|uniref:STP1 protein n=1 Tax=Plasmodium ovale curtisi TaxID=864141 RepID=A0A1A8WDB1_PLAOA|nr:STP1 protein [Plasmodium ovale curtisi]
MADDSEYTTITRGMHIGVFLAMIEGNIKKLIRKYGHKNCGLMHEELCEEIKNIISEKKKIVFNHMDKDGKKKWISDWDSKRNGFFKNLFEGEGFINMCYPPKAKGNQNLQKLKSRHIQFCKEKDERRSAVGNNPEYSVCRQYNEWINEKTASFTREFLKNVRDSNISIVKKYFSTKEHPKGHDPLGTYRNSKKNCEIYNPTSKRNQHKPVAKAPQNSKHPPTAPDLNQKSQGRGGKSIPGGDDGAEKEKSDVKIPPKPEPPASDSLASSQTKIKVDSTDNGQNADLKAKGTDHPSKDQGAKGKPTGATDTKAPSTQQLPESTSSISSKDSPVAIVPDPLPSVIKDQGTSSDSTPITTSTTSGTTHSTEKIQSSLTPGVSSAQPQPPAVATVTGQYSKEPTPPGPVSKSTDQDASLTSALDPGLAPTQAATSNTSASETSSTTTSSTMALTPGSSLAQDPHLLTPSTQTIVTTSIATTLTQTITSVSVPPTITVSAISTTPITSIIGIKSTTGESGEPNSELKTIPDSQDPNSASPKNKNSALPPNTGTSFPDTLSSPTSPNSNVILLRDPSYGPPLPVPSPGLPSGVSLRGPPSVLPDSQVVVTRSDSNQILTPSKDAPQQSKDSTKVSSTSLPKGTQPSDKSIITPTKFPPLTSIIPTIVIILATITLLFQLYKYTPFGFLLGRRRKRKKQDLRRIFEIPEKPTYESPNITVHEWEDPNLVGQTVKKDAYIKLLKINRYKQKLQKKKKKNKKTLIEVHMEVFEEYKNDEWELHKGDFLEICLRGFINEENETYQNFTNSELIVNNIKNEKTIEDIQKQEILWNNWIENHRNILEQWKEKEWFHILKNKWRNEQQKYKEKNNKLRENILDEQETHSIISQKDVWKQWISKQATLIDMFNKEDWFKSIVYVQDKEKNNYHINEYNNISVTNKTELKNEKTNYEQCRSKNIIQKLMVQIHMMVLEECIKEDIIKHNELCIDNFIEDIHNQNNYNEKRNILQCNTDDFNVLEFQEIHTSINK